MTDSINTGLETKSLIKTLEANTNSAPKQINTKTPEIPNDSVELSTKKDEKKSFYTKIAIAGAAIAAAVGTAIYLKKHPDKADDMIKEGRQKLNEAETKAKQQADERAKQFEKEIEENRARLVEENAKRAKEIEARNAQRIKKQEEANKAWEKQREEAKIAAAKQKHIDDVNVANDFLKERWGKTDDEIADILQAKYNDNLLGPSFQLSHAFIENKNFVADAIIEKASKIENPVEKERLLAKAIDFVSEKTDSYLLFNNINKLEEINGRLNSLYKTDGAEFKLKDTVKKAVSEKINKLYATSDLSPKLTEALGSDADYALYKKLCKASREYKDFFGHKCDPMALLCVTDVKRDRGLTGFLHDTLPKLIRDEKNIVKKEDLWFKYLNITRKYENGNRHTEFSFDILNKMNEAFYKNEVKLPKGETLKYKEEIQSQLKETVDEFIFKQFDIPAIKTDEEKMALAKKVIRPLNRFMFRYTPEDVKVEHITSGLVELGKETKNEKYIEAAIDAAVSKNEKKHASELVDKLLGSEENLSAGLKEKLAKIRDNFRAESKKAAQEISNTIKSKSLTEALNTFTSRPETKNAIEEIAQKMNLSNAQLIEKINQGDGETIRRVIKRSLGNANAEGFMRDLNATPIWEDVVTYLDKIDDVVKDKVELEYLQNIRLRALGAMVRTTKAATPEKSEGYREILKAQITDMLYAKGADGKLAKETIDEAAVDGIANYLERLVLVPIPEHMMYGSLEKLLERPYGFKQETLNLFKTKMQEIKDRLKIKTEEDFYNEFFNRFKSGSKGRSRASSKVSSETAYETLNKYIEGDKLSKDSTKAEIKSAYRKLALKYHPDTCSEANKEAYEEIFKEIGEAYGALR